MTIGTISPAQGMQSAETQLNRTAAQVAQWPSSEGDTVDLGAGAVALLQSKNNFEANVQAFKIGDEMTQSLLNAIG